jgi:hypothetical protein
MLHLSSAFVGIAVALMSYRHLSLAEDHNISDSYDHDMLEMK